MALSRIARPSPSCSCHYARWGAIAVICALIHVTSAIASATDPTPASINALVPVNVRIEGLALGNQLTLKQGVTTVTATLNEPLSIGTANAGTALSIVVLDQPDGQNCAVSEIAPAFVPSDASPVFVRCTHLPAPRLLMPTTLPDDPLSLWLGGKGMRAMAYPGIPYESRPGVIGGIFPYEFRLLGAQLNGTPISTSGIRLDFRRGTLRFTPAAAGNYEFSIEVRDSATVQKVLLHTYSIVASTTGFLFVAPNGVDAPGRGGINQPLLTVNYALTQSTSAQALLVRKGTYLGNFALLDGHAMQVMAYPDEVATIDLNGTGNILVRFNASPTARIEGIDIGNVRQYGIVSDASPPGVVLRHLRFLDGSVLNSSENPAFVHGWGGGATRHRILMQENEFGTYPAGYATTLFDAGDSIFENNQVRLISSSNGMHDKDNSQRNVYRENYFEYTPEFANSYGIQISAQHGSENVHIHHNLFINSGVMLGGQLGDMANHDVHHNTLVNRGIVLRWGVFNTDSRDTRLSRNLIRSSNAPYAWASCLNTVPAAFATQLKVAANRIETASGNAMTDTECGGSPMNMNWTTWRNTYAMDTVGSGSVLSATSDLVGSGALTRLPQGDPRLTLFGHRYPMLDPDSIFLDGFDH